jgi:hypothetical protein
MAGSDGVKSQSLGPFKEDIEFDVAVALNARVRAVPGGVTSNKWVDDVTIELFGVVKDVVVNVEHLGHSSGVINIGD